ncbi:transglutaminase-like domain-containing protein [Marivita geojedonensis]|uniref:Transglutaminase n=1 Tax=Marivita geojedonensis TaxID=1123756 RepID=A0A1X4NLC0_9RHOB|nr:transglutaminase family protein [Marivita geojedonensis]OSQ51076.1 transglutaminase [Marivita geojedonensis]PRY79913.1 transglutaminase superfamily protein [Marivita geojedonensis]
MILNIDVQLAYQVTQRTDMLLQIEAADLDDQTPLESQLNMSGVTEVARVAADDGIGERVWISGDGVFRCDYAARVAIDRSETDLSALHGTAPHLLPAEAVRYLMPSRYCPSDEFQTFVAAEFGGLEGGARITAIRDWINSAFSYVPGVSNAQTTALDSFVQRQGICRDFAHVMVTLARASAIPARFASVYAPGVNPPDFHAVAEVFLEGNWHLVDATGMAAANEIARIGVGADAANVAFLNVFGQAGFVSQSVSIRTE